MPDPAIPAKKAFCKMGGKRELFGEQVDGCVKGKTMMKLGVRAKKGTKVAESI